MPNTPNDDDMKKVLQYQNVELSPQQQAELNKPLIDTQSADPKDVEFLAILKDKIEKKEIELYRPSSLLNIPVYEKLTASAQAKADMDAFNLLSTIREIHTMTEAGQQDTFQIHYLVSRIRLTKERLEEVGGDIFII